MKRVLVVFYLLIFVSTGYCLTDSKTKEILSELTDMSIEELMELSVDTVYSASRFHQSLLTAPSSVSIITREEIKRYGYRTLAEVLGSVTGFYRTYDRNYDYIGIRGFSRPGDYNTRILLMIDGHRINDAVFLNSPVGTEFPLDVDMIEKVEVVRGPSSSLYGTNAFFAVVNVITRNAKQINGLETSFDVASYRTYKERVSFGYPFNNSDGLVASESYFDSKGHRRLYYREYDSPETNNGVAEGLDYDRFGNMFFHLKKGGLEFSTIYSKRKKGVPTASYDSVFNDPGYFTEEEYLYFDLKYEDELTPSVSLLTRASYNYFYDLGHFPFDYSQTDVPFVVINREYSKAYWINAEAQLTFNLSEKHRLILATEGIKSLKQEQKNYDIKVYLHDRRHTYSYAFLFQDEYRLKKSLIFNVGLRYDHYSTFGSSLNPRLAMIYLPTKKTSIKLLYGRAFRAPSVYELYYGDGDTQKPNPRLKPEKIDTYELVLEQKLSRTLKASISTYLYRTKKLITLKKDPSDGMLYFDNVDEVTAKGVELELSVNTKKAVMGNIRYAYQVAKNTKTHSVITNSPRHIASARISIPIIRRRLFGSLETLYSSKRKTVKGTHSGDVFVANLTFLARPYGENLELMAGVYNLFDRRYSYPASEEHRQDVIQQDGRTYRIKLTYRF